MMPRFRTRRSPLRLFAASLLALALVSGLAACGEGGGVGSVEAVRDTLPGGAERVRYGSLPVAEPATLEADLRIGVVEGDDPYVFGQVRGIEADEEGRIYVLDGQAGEVRVFGPDGTFRRAIARRGEGPGEVLDPNGILRAPDGTLWVQDPRRWLLVRITPEGQEVERRPMFVRQFGFVWEGSVDREGRLWVPMEHLIGPMTFPPEPGLGERAFRSYLRFHDPRDDVGDSVFVGLRTGRSFAVSVQGGGWGFRPIPWEPSFFRVVGPDGGVWAAEGDRYRISRLDARGDTVLVIEAAVSPGPVAAGEREGFLEAARERGGEEERIAREVLRAAREVKPVLAGLGVDDRGNLWVRRYGDEDEPPGFDVFDDDGRYLGSFRLPVRIPTYFPLRFREGRLYVLGLDEMDVQTVVRMPVSLPEG